MHSLDNVQLKTLDVDFYQAKGQRWLLRQHIVDAYHRHSRRRAILANTRTLVAEVGGISPNPDGSLFLTYSVPECLHINSSVSLKVVLQQPKIPFLWLEGENAAVGPNRILKH